MDDARQAEAVERVLGGNTRIQEALEQLKSTDWDYYDGTHVWCRFCRKDRPSPDVDTHLDWHDSLCVYRVAMEEL